MAQTKMAYEAEMLLQQEDAVPLETAEEMIETLELNMEERLNVCRNNDNLAQADELIGEREQPFQELSNDSVMAPKIVNAEVGSVEEEAPLVTSASFVEEVYLEKIVEAASSAPLVENSLNEELINNFDFDLRGNSIHSSATDEHLGQSTVSAESKPISVDEQLNESFATASVESEQNVVTVEVLGEEEAFVRDVEMESELIKPDASGDAQNEPMLESMVDSKEEAARVGVSAPVLGESGLFNDESLSESVATEAVVATDTVTTDNVATEADQQQELHSFAGDDLSFATPKVDNEVEAVETLISEQASEDGGSFEEGEVAAQNFGVENKEAVETLISEQASEDGGSF